MYLNNVLILESMLHLQFHMYHVAIVMRTYLRTVQTVCARSVREIRK